ncbi:MAG: immunoglobulin-like domain-containing protein [Bacilli bacterium]|jgi:hypothetical protein
MQKEKQNQQRLSRVRNLIVLCTLSAIILSVSTYAWFVGMQRVGVTPFTINIAVAESLSLSLDGKTWDSEITIDEDLETIYEGNTNSWGGEKGLKPISSIGEMEPTTSRMKLFEKSSMTTSPGGFRMLSSQIQNMGEKEVPGYVVFDLFIRNVTGEKYYENLDIRNEEAIYLTNDSEVVVSKDGIEDTGIENSVRIAFAQIGRVELGTADTKIIGITCQGDDDVTGICSEDRGAIIWEPNDKTHNKNALSWYEESCLGRTGFDIRSENSFSGNCGTVIDGLYYPTYAFANEIGVEDNIDVYDGLEYNGYVHDWKTSLDENGEEQKNDEVGPALIQNPQYFTDTMKYKNGTERPTFMTLAPRSITKVRVYIYLEGQDIDNYEYAAVGAEITVNFGFTKQRFVEGDIGYDGEDVNLGLGPDEADKTKPVIEIEGENPLYIDLNDEFNAPEATAYDSGEEMTEAEIEIVGTVNPAYKGEYTLIYKVKDTEGNLGTKALTVYVGYDNGEDEPNPDPEP